MLGFDDAKKVFQSKLSTYMSGYKTGWFSAICNQVTRFFSFEKNNLPPSQAGYNRAVQINHAISQCDSSEQLIVIAKEKINAHEGKTTPKLLKRCVIEAAGFTEELISRYAVQYANEYNKKMQSRRASTVMLPYGWSPVGGESYIAPQSLFAKERAINLIYQKIAISNDNGQSFLSQLQSGELPKEVAPSRVVSLWAGYCCR